MWLWRVYRRALNLKTRTSATAAVVMIADRTTYDVYCIPANYQAGFGYKYKNN